MRSDLAESQLMMIEQVWGIRFGNREEIASWIAGVVQDDRQVLSVTSSINNLVAARVSHGTIGPTVTITRGEFDRMVRDIRW